MADLPLPRARRAGCEIWTFTDPDFEGAMRRDYRAITSRALEVPDPRADPRRQPARAAPSDATPAAACADRALFGARTPASDDCLSEGEQRAWSSPI